MSHFVFRKLYGCKKTISKSKSVILQKNISDCNGDQKKLFKIVDTLLVRNKKATLPKYNNNNIYLKSNIQCT